MPFVTDFVLEVCSGEVFAWAMQARRGLGQGSQIRTAAAPIASCGSAGSLEPTPCLLLAPSAARIRGMERPWSCHRDQSVGTKLLQTWYQRIPALATAVCCCFKSFETCFILPCSDMTKDCFNNCVLNLFRGRKRRTGLASGSGSWSPINSLFPPEFSRRWCRPRWGQRRSTPQPVFPARRCSASMGDV